MKCFVLGAFCAVSVPVLAASLDEQGFVRDWLLSGPWPSYQVKDRGQGLATDFLKSENEALPYPDKPEKAEFVADWGKLVAGVGSVNEWGFQQTKSFDASWRVFHAERGIIRFGEKQFAPIEDYFVCYAACYVEVSEDTDAFVQCGSDDDHRVFLDLDEIGTAESSQDILPGNFKYACRFPRGVSRLLFKLQDRTGGCGFCVQLTDRAGLPLRGVNILLDPRGRKTTLEAKLELQRSPEKLQERKAAAERVRAAAEANLELERTRNTNLLAACRVQQERLRQSYADYELKCARMHAENAAKGRRSAAEPFKPEMLRSSLCVNGFWESSVDGGKSWNRTYLPSRLVDEYFHSWQFPVKAGGKGPLPGFEDVYDPIHIAEKARFRTTFEFDGKGVMQFRCEAIIGIFAEFFLNGEKVGSWNGDRGIVRIPLADARIGQNVFEIAVSRGSGHRQAHGIRGSLFFEQVGKVRVDETWIKTSWRKSAIGVRTVLANDGDAEVEAKVASYAVKDGKVHFRLPVRTVSIPARGNALADARDYWADPELWGIGGEWGEPNLYTLITDVEVDGKIVDRAEEEFGFREFWIHHTDFFLNGKRIFLQGDVGHIPVDDKRYRDVVWPLLRKDGINLIRVHDTDQWSITAVRDADRMGMAICAQMYPKLEENGKPVDKKSFTPFERWKGTQAHRDNLAAYERWWKDLRNHPSVLIWSTDNEILTQAWDTEADAEYNVRSDRIGALYEKYVDSLDPSLVMTRDGDVGTWNRQGRWYEDPPCDTANFHYPNHENERRAVNWQKVYEYRPIVFGEALYCSYFVNRKWLGALPDLVAKKSEMVRKCVGLYTKLEIPCAIYMGLGLDGFFVLDDSGHGNPWGIKAGDVVRFKREGAPPPGRSKTQYPWLRIAWPAYSGEGERPPAASVGCNSYASHAFNVYEAGFPTHVRNAVNDAYRDALRPLAPVDAGCFAEAIVKARPHEDVWTFSASGAQIGVRADSEGRAWFRSLQPGMRTFESSREKVAVDLKRRGDRVAEAGFVGIPEIELGRGLSGNR